MKFDLLQGDCIELMKTTKKVFIDAVITDPPYSSGGMFRADRMKNTVEKYVQPSSIDTWRNPFTGDNLDQRVFLIFTIAWMRAALAITKPGGMIACFTDWRQLPAVTDALQLSGWVWRGIATWWKPGIRMQRGRFSLSAEYIVVGSNGDVVEGEGSPQNVFSCPPVLGKNKSHIAEKPVSVLNWVMSATPKGATILDPFMGSGTTGVSCAQMDRDFVGIDIDHSYIEKAKERISAASKQPNLDNL